MRKRKSGGESKGNVISEIVGKGKIKCIKCEDIIDIKVGYNAR